MQINIKDILPLNYQDYKLEDIESGASKKKYFRIKKKEISYILVIFTDKYEFDRFTKIQSIFKEINISTPNILEEISDYNILILEDFGHLRFDKILKKISIKELLKVAVDSLIIMNKEIQFNQSYNLLKYNFKNLKNEISEFVDYYFPYLKNHTMNQELKDKFYLTWENKYNSIDFNFNNFVHKDFNLNNLIYLPERKDYKKCGIIDFQDAFWGQNSWDLFSLLEDSRVYFDNQYNDYFIEYFFKNTNPKQSYLDFKNIYHFLNVSRQTRLLGRWIKLSSNNNQNSYLNYIESTKKRLYHSLNDPFMKELKIIYNNII